MTASGSKRFVVLRTEWWQCIAAGVPFLMDPGDSLTVVDPKDYLGPMSDRGVFETDVIMNPHRAPMLARVWTEHPEHVILYETENLISAAGWRQASEQVRRRAPRNEWWNYSAANSAVFGDTPKPLRIPLGQTAAHAGAKDVDVLFVGSMNERRRSILTGLMRAGAKVFVAPMGTFGPDLAQLEARARVVLNVHYYSPGIFESFRVVPAAARGARVVSEFSINGEGAEFCARVASYQNLKNAVLEELERK
jgi:hypothetical protein